MFLWILHKLLQMTTVLSNMFHTLAFKVYFTGKKIWFSTMIIYDYQNDLGMNNVLLTVCICVRNEKEKWRVSSCRWREPGDILVRLCDILSFLLVTPHHWQTMIAELVTIVRVYHCSHHSMCDNTIRNTPQTPINNHTPMNEYRILLHTTNLSRAVHFIILWYISIIDSAPGICQALSCVLDDQNCWLKCQNAVF